MLAKYNQVPGIRVNQHFVTSVPPLLRILILASDSGKQRELRNIYGTTGFVHNGTRRHHSTAVYRNGTGGTAGDFVPLTDALTFHPDR